TRSASIGRRRREADMTEQRCEMKCHRRDAETPRNPPRNSICGLLPRRLSRRSRRLGGCISLLILAVIAGCLNTPIHPPTTQPATIADPATTQPEYWYAQPSPGTAV